MVESNKRKRQSNGKLPSIRNKLHRTLTMAASKRLPEFIAANPTVDPTTVALCCNKKFDFKCDNCSHIFSSTCSNVEQGRWCPFCAGKKLCGEKSCPSCFARSVASSPKVECFIIANPDVPPCTIIIKSTKKYKWSCEACAHTFEATPATVDANQWCPFCSKRSLCGKPTCDPCRLRSLVTSVHVDAFTSANPDVSPLTVAISSNKKVKWQCESCPHLFEMAPNDAKRFWCPFCAKKKLCGQQECGLCFKRSLAALPQVQSFIIANPTIDPNTVAISCNERYNWQCDKCPHTFLKRVNTVQRGSWCPYCASKRLCGNETCMHCFNRSLASSPRAAAFAAANPTISLVTIPISSNEVVDWLCDSCDHRFTARPGDVHKGNWCPFCGGRRLCGEHHCNFCFIRSVASSTRVNEFVAANPNAQPLAIFKSSRATVNWKCSACSHEFAKAFYSVEADGWCPYCAGQRLCGDRTCLHCFNRSIASSTHIADLVPEDGFDPWVVHKSTHDIFNWRCGSCTHIFPAAANKIQSGRWCPFCGNGKVCGQESCLRCAPRCSVCFDIRKSFHRLRDGRHVCTSHYLQSNEAPRKIRLELLFLAELQRVSNEEQKFEFCEPTSWDCSILPGLSFKPDMLWAFDQLGNVFSIAGACKINTGLIHQIIILEVLEVGIEQHSAVSHISDHDREQEIRSSLSGLIVDFVYVVIAAYNHKTAHRDDQFFTLDKSQCYVVAPSRRAAWDQRVRSTIAALSQARKQKFGTTVFIGH